jgi:uncharacterized protein YqiB (DUF1249 family)
MHDDFEANDEARQPDFLLGALADTIDQIDGPTEAAVDRAAALFALRHLDAELLVVLSDTSTAAEVMVARAEQLEWRLVIFRGQHSTVQIELAHGDHGVDLIGQVTPAGTHVVALRHDGTPTESFETDQHGRFRDRSPEGPFRVHITLSDGTNLLTPLITP